MIGLRTLWFLSVNMDGVVLRMRELICDCACFQALNTYPLKSSKRDPGTRQKSRDGGIIHTTGRGLSQVSCIKFIMIVLEIVLNRSIISTATMVNDIREVRPVMCN